MHNIKKIVRADFEIKTKKSIFRLFLGFFPKNQPNEIFFEKSGFVTFLHLWIPNIMQKNKKILNVANQNQNGLQCQRARRLLIIEKRKLRSMMQQMNLKDYLSDNDSQTEFMRYRNVRTKAGRGIMFPAYFTHTHRGSICKKGLDRYIISGYYSFIWWIKSNF